MFLLLCLLSWLTVRCTAVFIVFVKPLLVWSTAHWRSLLLLLLGVCLPLLGFSLLAASIVTAPGSMAWETALMLAIHLRATLAIDGIANAVTRLGSAYWVTPIVVAIAVRFVWGQRWRSLAYLLITLLGCIATNLAAKAYWHRLRPHLWDGYLRPQDFSFPSGHAMTSMAIAAVLIALTWGSRWVWLTAVLGGVYVLAIAWTRLYLGVHYPSDILAGWLLAIAWAAGMSVLLTPHVDIHKDKARSDAG